MDKFTSNDKRSKRTRQIIKNALIKLLKDKQISKISVSELCRNADVTRNSFYRYYNVPEDVLTDIEEDILAQLKGFMADTGLSYKERLLNSLASIKDNKEISYLMMLNSLDHNFLEKAVSIYFTPGIYNLYFADFFPSVDIAEKYFRFSSAGAIGLIRLWITDNFKESPRELFDIMEKIAEKGKYGFK